VEAAPNIFDASPLGLRHFPVMSNIILRPEWHLPERRVTPERAYRNRRQFLREFGYAGGGLLAGAALLRPDALAAEAKRLYPAKRNIAFSPADLKLSDERVFTTYNNFYEFGTDKSIWRDAQKLEVRPWTIKVGGMVEKPFEIGIDDLLARVQLEERVYRHRCVETWSMIVPWTGFPVRSLVELCKPLGGAKFIVMKTLSRPSVMREQRDPLYPWPYTEGLAMDEAMNDLAFIATGLYGKPMPKQNGAPLRLVAPWKYGFKNVKSIVSVEFTDKKPKTFWEGLQSSEYGFWANVNPEVAHPRWSQATEKPLGSEQRIPTLLYNGYAEFVAGLYTDRKAEKLFM